MVGEVGEASEHPQRESPGPRAASVVGGLDPREHRHLMLGFRRHACHGHGQRAVEAEEEEGAEDAGPDGVVGGGEVGGEAEEDGVGEEARFGGEDAQGGGDRGGDGGRRRGSELPETRGDGVDGAEARGGVAGAESPVEVDAPLHGGRRRR